MSSCCECRSGMYWDLMAQITFGSTLGTRAALYFLKEKSLWICKLSSGWILPLMWSHYRAATWLRPFRPRDCQTLMSTSKVHFGSRCPINCQHAVILPTVEGIIHPENIKWNDSRLIQVLVENVLLWECYRLQARFKTNQRILLEKWF